MQEKSKEMCCGSVFMRTAGLTNTLTWINTLRAARA